MARQQNDFYNKVVWITGASSGVGEALAYAFAEAGARLVLSARREQELIRVKDNCAHHATVRILPLDLSQADTLPGKVSWVQENMGGIDILVNNAGISQRSLTSDTSIDVYRRIMEINFFGAVHLSYLVLRYFLSKNAGQFVVMSSVTGKVGLPYRAGYSASKHAVEGFFSALRTETWNTNIRILLVRSGAVRTHIAENALQGDGTPFNQKDMIIEKGIDPETCAKVIVLAITKNKRQVVTGSAREKLLFILNRWVPKLVFNVVKKIQPRRVF